MFGARLLGRIPFGVNGDSYSMFRKTKTQWWTKENVPSKREVLEEDDDILKLDSKGLSCHMHVKQCIEGSVQIL